MSTRLPFAGDTAYGAVRLLRWLVDRITPHVPVDKSARTDSTFILVGVPSFP